MIPLTKDEISEAVLDLPALPHIVLELFRALDKEDVDANFLSQKISYDQALAAKVLGLANSSFYGMQGKVGSIAYAVAVLGFGCIRSLATAAGLAQIFSGRASSELHAQLWTHAIATALAARSLAKCIGENEDQAFIAGLLHNIGRLVLITHYPVRYQDVLSWSSAHDAELSLAEVAVLGVDHKLVGRAVLTRWKFPASIVATLDTVAQGAPDLHGKAASVIVVADAIAHALDLQSPPDNQVPVIPQSQWDQLGLSEAILTEVFSSTEKSFEDVCAILRAP
ncbi:HDOD domain-containing protein [Herbaspirillum sp.]|uniref:HDOD domain-containing protein n=1 Tax=Herbaspirillum sp. TaxID=1890675 RepID=UPI0031DDFFC4